VAEITILYEVGQMTIIQDSYEWFVKKSAAAVAKEVAKLMKL
jgi:hypothetical protein